MNTKKDINSEEENPEKYFDESNYSTLVVGPEKFTTPKKMIIEDVVEILTSGKQSLKNEALQLLKEQNAQRVLIDAIEDDEYVKNRQLLVAACWESGLVFDEFYDLFIELAGDSNALVSLEAITVLENIESFETKEKATEAAEQIATLIKKKHPNAAMMEDVRIRFEEIAHEM